MSKINNDLIYVQDSDISDLDFLIGSNGNTTAKRTQNFLLGSLRNHILSGLSPLTGGTLQFTEITYTGGLYSTFAQVVNNLDPSVSVLQYHVVVVTLNGAKAILKLQNRLIGLEETAVVDGDFIVLPTSVGATGATGGTGATGATGSTGATGATGKGVSTVVKTGTVGLVDTYTITFTDASTTTFTVTNGAVGADGVDGVDASNNLQRDMSVSFSVADSDNNYVIQLKNASAIIVTVPDTLSTAKFCCGFIRKGVGEVSFVGSGTATLNNPIGFRINAQYDPAFLERDNASQNYTLLGNTKV